VLIPTLHLLRHFLHHHQGYIVFLLILRAGKVLEQALDQTLPAAMAAAIPAMLLQPMLEPLGAEHAALRVVCLHQPIRVEQEAVLRGQCGLLLGIRLLGHQTQQHAPGIQRLYLAIAAQVGQVVAGIGVAQPPAAWVQDGKKAGGEGVRRNAVLQQGGLIL